MNPQMRRRQLAFAALLSGMLFLAMALLRVTHVFAVLDLMASDALTSLRNDFLTGMLVLLTEIFNIPFMAIFIAGMAAVLLWTDKRLSLRFAFTSAMGVFLFSAIKIAIHESRPVGGLIDVAGFGFPSGHATVAAILFVFLAELFERVSKKPAFRLLFNLAALCMIIIVGLSRLYLGVHALSDILAGMLLGVFTTSIVSLAFDRFSPPPAESR